VDDALNADFSKLEGSLARIDKLLASMTDHLSTFSSNLQSANVGGGFGAMGLGQGSFSQFTSGTFGNIPSMLGANRRLNLMGGIAQGALNIGGGFLGGALGALPDVASTLGRARGYYDTGVISGQAWRGIQLGTFSRMNGGLTMPGGDMVASRTLAGMGIIPGTGQYNNLIASIGGAAKYMNMDNGVAAQALGGLTSGATSAGLMRNYGIYTTNPMTGQRMAPTQIFEQINQRLTLGRKVTRNGLLNDYQAGILKENLMATGLDQNQQTLALQYMLDKASGKNTDLASLNAQLSMGNNDNPMAAQYSLNTTATADMQAATDAYISGTKGAAAAVEELHKAIRGLIQSFPQLAQGNAFAQTLLGDSAISSVAAGVGQMFSGAAGIAGSIGSYYFGGKALNAIGLGKGKSPAPKPATKSSGYFNKKSSPAPKTSTSGMKGGLKTGGLAALFGIPDIISGFASGNPSQIGQGIGTSLGALAGGAAGAFVPIAGETGISEVAGAMAGGNLGGQLGSWIGSFFGGANDRNGTGSSSDTKKGKWLSRPVSAGITCHFGTVDTMHPTGHRGTDFGCGLNTKVQAAGAGKVKEIGYEAGGYGKFIVIDHGDGYTTLYGHLNSIKVSHRQQVSAGTVIAASGSTGRSTGPHLHFSLLKNGTNINPEPALGIQAPATAAKNKGAGAGKTPGFVTYTASAGSSVPSAASAGGAIGIPSSYAGASIGGFSAQSSSYSGFGAGVGIGQSMVTGTSTRGIGGAAEPMGGGNNVTINLSVAQASEEEARRFAHRIKEYLDDHKMISNMGVM
jgi:hypothetical protein